jgi:hypothetical protein
MATDDAREWLDRMDEIDDWRAATDVRQDALEARQEVVEERVGHVEEQVGEIARLVPEIMDKLGSQPRSPAHPNKHSSR